MIKTANAAPTITASSAYSAGQSVGGLLTFNAVAANNGSALLQKVVVQSKSSQSSQLDLLLFDSQPTASTIADKTTFSLNTADFIHLIGVVHVTDWTSLGTPSAGFSSGLAMPIRANGGTNIYGALVTRGTPTYGSTSDLSIVMQFIPDM